MKFVLDTDTCIYALKHNDSVIQSLLQHQRSDVTVSVLTEAELRTGAAKSRAPEKTLKLVENFLRPLRILEFLSTDAIAYAGIRAGLEQKGAPIGPIDMLIAAQALARKLILVSNNTREFKRVKGLRLENWLS